MIGVLLILALAQAGAENWPCFRGLTGQGVSTETNLPVEWNATNNVAWKTPIPGEGWSSPIVWGERVFLTATLQDGVKCHVLCLDAGSGRILWDTEVLEQAPTHKEKRNSFATPTPCADGERVYAVFSEGSVAALSFAGKVLWTNREVKFYSRHGLGASPLLHDGLLVMPYDGSMRVTNPGVYPNNTEEEKTGWQIAWDKAFIAALDARTGRRVWTAKRGMSKVAHATPIVLREGNRAQIISCAGDCIQSFDPKTGALLRNVFSLGEGVTATPVTGDGLIFTASGARPATLRTVRTGGKGDVVWEHQKGVPMCVSPLYVKPYLYTVTDAGMVNCLQAATGEVVYQERLRGRYGASPVYADGRIYLLLESGETVVFAPGPQFKILARNPLDEKCQASMAVSGRRLFIRTDKHVYCIR